MAQHRTHYRNGDEITLLCGCNSCSPSRINGILCHEEGCPDDWRDYAKECNECGQPYYHPNTLYRCENCQKDLQEFHADDNNDE